MPKFKPVGPGDDTVPSPSVPASGSTGPGFLQGPTATGVTSGLTEQFLDNMLGVPEFIARGLDFGESLPSKFLKPETAKFLFGDGAVPTPADQSILGLPSGREVMSGAQALPAILGGQAPREAFDAAMANREQVAQESPTAFGVGQFGGDVATLATGRAPFRAPAAPTSPLEATMAALGQRAAPNANRAGGVFDNAIGDGLSAASAGLRRTAGSAGVRKQLADILDTDMLKEGARGFGRAAETGLEGATLAALQEGDPVETAAFAAGGQLVSSAALAGAAGVVDLPGKILNLEKLGPLGKRAVGIAASATILSQYLQVLQQNPDEAQENAYDKISTMLVAGGVLGLAGKRPKAGGALENFPRFADALLTAPRTGIIKAAQSLAEDPEGQALVTSIAADPGAFSPKQIEQIERAMSEGTLSELAADPKFERPNPRVKFSPVE